MKIEDFLDDLKSLCDQYWHDDYKMDRLSETGYGNSEIEHKIVILFKYGQLTKQSDEKTNS